ncbi:MAG: DUF1553 domain-containing protein [Verrucomicrobiales bacterium]|nr:DUF1553 domain-containing protein [Verrucomicrobiales bacterium]
MAFSIPFAVGQRTRSAIAAAARMLLGVACFNLAASSASASDASKPLDFNQVIRPILAENCYQCHGQDPRNRKGKLRLDTEAGSRTPIEGRSAIVPGDPSKSELWRRLRSADPEERMPPSETHKAVSEPQQELLRRWIVEGGAYDRHWAFKPARHPELPAVHDPHWVRRPLDAFVLARLDSLGLTPNLEGAPASWLRKASFDLTGLPPSPDDLDRFERDVATRGDVAYESAADRLLQSPAFGERQAQEWLDIARYADTHGFNNDTTRTLWRWRDWVIDAFNSGKPYDQFVVEQLAGDLLPNPTLDQRIATGFGRNHVVNSEGGIIDEEYRTEYVADRVRTLGMAWLGLTLECSRCHDHKYDPLTQRDYYRLFAFFNQVPESGEDGRIGNAAPILVAPTPADARRLSVIEASIRRDSEFLESVGALAEASAVRVLRERLAPGAPPAPEGARFSLDRDLARSGERIVPPNSPSPASLELPTSSEFIAEVAPAEFSAARPWTLVSWVRWDGQEAPVLSTMDKLVDPSSGNAGRGAEVRVTSQGRVEIRIAEFWPAYAIQARSRIALSRGRWHHLAVTFDGSTHAAALRLLVDGQVDELTAVRDGLSGRSASGHAPRVGRTIEKIPELFHGAVADLRLYTNAVGSDVLTPWIDGAMARWLAFDSAGRATRPDLFRRLALQAAHTEFAAAWNRRERAAAERLLLLQAAPQTMVMEELPTPRVTHLLTRGRYDAPSEVVSAGVPEDLLGPWPEGAPLNRLGLARWLVQPRHPLTARVVVNRFWAQCFGTGLVKTVEDFGVQGESPSHPELLDALATSFVDSGWDVRGLLRELVLSATYRQDSAAKPEQRERDPENRWLSRGPRSRLVAETLRDHALFAAGSLAQQLGGPSVFPPQPETLYQGVVVAADYPGTKWIPSQGADRYRRSLYTFWKRTVPHPVMTTFDAPDREACTARRLPTNTPLQALALLNEPTFVECGRLLGRRALAEGTVGDEDRLATVFRIATSRRPDGTELRRLTQLLTQLRRDFAADPDGTARWLGRPGTAEEAAWEALGGVILNLDESITKG